MRCRSLAVMLLLLLLLAGAGLGLAQETTGTIQGRIVDAQGLVLPGATVTATGPQGTRSATSDTDGRFTIPFLTPGAYSVRAELQGFRPAEHTDVSVRLGQTVDLPLTLAVGAVTELVTVTATAPLVDTRSTTTGEVIKGDLTRQIPVGRRISDVAYLAPGVSNSGSVGQANPSMSGGTGLDNLYVVDGVNVTNQGYGAIGSYSIVFGSLGTATPFDFIEEFQVKTGGYESEFGQSTGGILNVVTKSGTNAVHGSAFGYARRKELEGAWKPFQSTNGTIQTLSSSLSDAGVEGGGPIIRDRLFFFGAIDPQWETRTLQAPQEFPLFNTGGYARTRRNLSYSAKATAQLASNHRVDASFFGDPSTGAVGPQRAGSLLRTTTSAFSELDYGGHNQTVRYNGVLRGNWLVEATLARALSRITETPSVNAWSVRDNTVTPNVFSGGVGFYEQGNRSLNQQYAARTTYLVGAHQIKGGYAFDDVSYDLVRQYTGPTFTAADGRTTSTGATITIVADSAYGRIYRVGRANFNPSRPTIQKYQNFFVQDSWKVGSRVTINPGLRYEQETLGGTIITDWTLKNNWAPRVGAAYDMTGDGKAKVFGSFGVFYARIPNDLASRALSADDGIARADYFDANLTQPIPNGVLAGGVTNHFVIAGVGADVIDPDAKLSYVREFVLGVEREILTHTTFSVRWINRKIPRVLEDIANVPMAAYDLGVPGVGSVEYILTNPTSASEIFPAAQFLGAKFDDPVHKYDAIEVTLNRRGAEKWSLLTSYRWSRLRGNFEGFYRDDNGQSDPGITSLYDFPTNDPSYTAIGVPQFGYEGDIRYLGDPNGILPLDRPHQAKAFGTYQVIAGLHLGLALNLVSGKPLTPFAPNPNYTNGGEIPTAPRGSGIETIDGFRTRTPFESQVDLQASYNLKVAGRRQLTLLADVFNVFNQRRTIGYDTFTSTSFGAPANPDAGKPISQIMAGPQFQAPIQVRLGARFNW